ncbi:MAG: beta-lactamase family protein [Gemmatimonadota bacterium]|nr:beta-lactamase family protein [Gemmatimonadota bacterium]
MSAYTWRLRRCDLSEQEFLLPYGPTVPYADLENGTPATGATSFHLASLTKTFASTIIIQLVEHGLVDLDDPVSDYGIDLPSSGVIRVRHLMASAVALALASHRGVVS